MGQIAYDTHHLCWPRKRWNKGLARVLRYHWYMKVKIPMRTLHRTIHEELAGVPVPESNEIKRALRHLDQLAKIEAISENDDIEKRLAIIVPLFTGWTSYMFNRQFEIATKFLHDKRRKES